MALQKRTAFNPDDTIISPPAYMLVKVNDGLGISVLGLPPSVVPIAPIRFTYRVGPHKYVKLLQFPVTLAYAITDFKCRDRLSIGSYAISRNLALARLLLHLHMCNFHERGRCDMSP